KALLEGVSGAHVSLPGPVSRPRRRIALGVTIVAVLAIAGVVGARLLRSSPGGGVKGGGPSLAVLPFENLQGDSASNYFSDGISEEILGTLSRLPGLRVLGRSVTFRNRGRAMDAKQLGRELGVSHVLEGSVQHAGSHVRVNARLTDAASGFSVWSDRYDRDLTDIFGMEDAIAQEIAKALDVRLVGGVHGPAGTTTNPQAHDQYLLGLAARNRRDVKQAAALFSRAIALDSSYAAAWAGLSSVLVLLPEYDLKTNADSAMTASRAAAARALALDSTQVNAHLALAYGAKMRGRDFPRADAEYVRALALDPNLAEAHHWHGELLMELARFDDATAEFAKSLEQDREAPATHAMLAMVLFRRAEAGRPALVDSAIAACRRSNELSPPGGVFPFEFACGAALTRARRFGLARPYLVRAGRASGDSTLFASLMDGVSDASKRDVALARLAGAEGRGLDPVFGAVWYLLLSDPDRATAALERAERAGSPFQSYLEVLDFSGLPATARLRALRTRLGYP
ncbi:MAG: hypothetical protein ACHQQ3_14635, partial [Gemmatimonadales bacterium]